MGLLLLGTGCGGADGSAGGYATVVDLSGADAEIKSFLGEARAAAQRHPQDGARRGALAMAYEANGFADAALANYAKARRLAPTDPRWPYHSAMLLAHQGELEAALDALRTAIELDPAHGAAMMWQGAWLLDLGRLDEADAAFATAQRLGVGAAAVAGQARVALRRGRADAAADLLRPLGDALLHSDVAGLLAAAARRLGRAQEARAALAAVRAGPLRWTDTRSDEKRGYEASLAAKLASARRSLAADDAEAALAAATALRDRHPRHQGLLAVQAEAYRRLGRRGEAMGVLREAVAAHPDRFSFHLNLAELLIDSDAGDAAMAHLNRALALNPRIPWAHAQRGLLLLAEGDLSSALAAFGTAWKLDPRNPEPRYYAGMAEASRQRWPQAIAHFSAAVRAAPSFTLGHVGLGRALAEAGRFDEGRLALAEAERLGTHPREAAAAREWLARRATATP